jgi:subtilase-type serine protease
MPTFPSRPATSSRSPIPRRRPTPRSPTAAQSGSGTTPPAEAPRSTTSAAGAGNLYLGANALIVGSNNQSATFSGIISDCGIGGTACVASGATGGSLYKVGTGTLTLTGQESVLGGEFFVQEGAIVLDGAKVTTPSASGSLGGSLTITNGAVLTTQNLGVVSSLPFLVAAPPVAEVLVTGAGSKWDTAELMIGISLNGPGAGVLTIADGGVVTSGASVTIGSLGTLKIGTGAKAGTIVATQINNGGEIIADFTDTSTIAANITGSGTITKNGTGTLILSGTSSYGTAGTVSTFVNGGTLSILASSALGAGDASFANGTTFSLSTGGSYIDNNIFITGNVTFNVDSGVTSGIGNSGTTGTIDGAGTLIKMGAGTLGLAGDNTYTGDTHVREGTLQIDHAFASPATTNLTVNTGATYAISSGLGLVDVNSLADGPNGGGSVTIGGGSELSIGFLLGGATTTFGGAITGDGSLSIEGGVLTLTGVSLINGDLEICFCGSLTISGPGASFTATGLTGSVGGTEVLGTLNVLNGAAFKTNDLYVEGRLIADGNGTVVTAEGGTIIGPVAGFGTDPATVTISGGAVMNSQNGAVIEDPFGATTPVVNVTGAGSTWNVSKTTFPFEALSVGGFFNGGTGSLMVSAGGIVNVTGGAVIGSAPGFDSATATVTGAGSRLNVDDLFVGLSSCGCPLVGTLTVSDGGVVNATNSISIGDNSTLFIGAGALGGAVLAPAIDNEGAIIANFTDVITLAANISGAGTLQKLGSGTLFLTGASTYTGDTTIDGGKLAVNGSITSNVFVNAGGTLGGSGSVGATTINAGGALSPGNSIGTITINGSLTFAGAGNYIVEVSPTAGLADRTNVIGAPGTADLGGTITAVGTGYGYKIGSTYTVLNATGGVNNTFSSLAISGSFGSTRPRVEYDANNVYILFDANSLALTGLTPNQTAVANTINTALQQGIQPLAFDVAFNSPLGLDLLSGEVHASALGVLLDESLYPRSAVLGRLRQASYGGNTSMASLSAGGPQSFATDGTGFDSALAFAKSPIVRKAPLRAPQASGSDLVFWAQGFGAWGKFDSDGNAASVRRDLAGFFTGVDTRAGDAGRIGIAAGYTGSKVSLDGRGTATLDTGHVMAYGGWNFGALNLRAGGAFAHHSINTDRTIALPGFFDRAFSSTAGYTGQVFGEGGYGFNMQGVALEAFAGAAWVRVHANGTTERGGDAALNVGARSFEVGYSTLGLRAATIVPLANSMILVPRVTVAWQHAFGGTTPGVVNAFAAAPALPFAIQGAPIARDSLLAEAGVDVAITPQMTFGVSYTGQIARNVSDHGAKGKFSYRF